MHWNVKFDQRIVFCTAIASNSNKSQGKKFQLSIYTVSNIIAFREKLKCKKNVHTYSGGDPRKLYDVKMISTRWPGPAKNMYKHCREWFDILLRTGEVKVPFCAPPGRDTKVWSHSVNEREQKMFFSKFKIYACIKLIGIYSDQYIKWVHRNQFQKSDWPFYLAPNLILTIGSFAPKHFTIKTENSLVWYA